MLHQTKRDMGVGGRIQKTFLQCIVPVWIQENVPVWIQENVHVWIRENVPVWIQENVRVCIQENIAAMRSLCFHRQSTIQWCELDDFDRRGAGGHEH